MLIVLGPLDKAFQDFGVKEDHPGYLLGCGCVFVAEFPGQCQSVAYIERFDVCCMEQIFGHLGNDQPEFLVRDECLVSLCGVHVDLPFQFSRQEVDVSDRRPEYFISFFCKIIF